MTLDRKTAIPDHENVGIVGEHAARAQCLVLSIEISICMDVYGHTFHKSMRGCQFSNFY
jgi:hypothetical protein